MRERTTDSMHTTTDFALFRMPNDNCATRFDANGDAQELAQYEELNNADGFVFAPFAPSQACPILLIQPKRVERISIAEGETTNAQTADGFSHSEQISVATCQANAESYSKDFRSFHRQLEKGAFKKLVLSRIEEVELNEEADVERLFMSACRKYPDMFVALVSTRRSGTWLMATPEILLNSDGREWRTMALAGTVKRANEKERHEPVADLWSEKNREEQQIVAQYIDEQLQAFADEITQTQPYTQRAGTLLHLRTDFTFRPKKGYGAGNIASALHPTPAVCGLPKAESQAFISSHESCRRQYYSGFAGVVSPAGAVNLFVSLRCMKIDGKHCQLYAGGGLLKSSSETKEWEETAAKMETMKALLNG